jgi:NAD(P)-dependent dehydrogenase (short-subunit alcohol dehydrogenase family)
MTQSPNLRPDCKTAAITGGASGVGLAIAKTFAAAGALVKILDLNMANIGTVETTCAADFGRVLRDFLLGHSIAEHGNRLRRQRRAILRPESTAWTYSLKTK